MAMLAAQLLLPSDGAAPASMGLAARRTRPVTLPGVISYAGIIAAPIFAPDRRPGAGGGETLATSPALAGYAALGAATGPALASAVVSTPEGAARVVRRGEDVDGWKLIAIDRVRLTFERRGERQVLVVGAPAAALSEAADAAPAPPGVAR